MTDRYIAAVDEALEHKQAEIMQGLRWRKHARHRKARRRNRMDGPRHVAIIMDGNGRWAQARGRPRLFGHHAGARRVREIVSACPDLGVEYLTIFAFSTENWKRTQTEVAGLMSLFRRYIMKEMQDFVRENVRVRFIGDRPRLDAKLRALMDEAEAMTRHCTGTNLTIALNYGGRDEVSRATKRLAEDVAAGRLKPRGRG